MKKSKKYILFFSVIIILLIEGIFCSPIVNANTTKLLDKNEIIKISSDSTGIDDIIGGVHNFEQAGQELSDNSITGGMTVDDENMQNISSLVYNTLLILGIVVVVIVGLVIGIKFMTGSVEQKAEIKQTLPPYIVGCIIIFGAFTIWSIVVNVLNQT